MTSSAMQPIRFTVVMPAFNAAATIAAAIESLLGQTYAHFELLVVDDCSSDGTIAIVQSFAKRATRVRLLLQPSNRGAAACMNAGACAAGSEWIGIFDADAVAPAGWLEQAAEIAAQGYDAFGGGCNYFAPTNGFERVAFAFEADDTAATAETLDTGNPREPTIRGTNFFFTRHCYERVGGFAEDIRAAYDRLFLCNAIESGCRVRFDPILRVRHPLPGASLGEFMRRKNAMERWRLLAAERSPILQKVYRPIWPAILTLVVGILSALCVLGLSRGAAALAMCVVLGAAALVLRGLRRGLPMPLAVVYACVDALKKILTVAIYVLRLQPKCRDWKARTANEEATPRKSAVTSTDRS